MSTPSADHTRVGCWPLVMTRVTCPSTPSPPPDQGAADTCIRATAARCHVSPSWRMTRGWSPSEARTVLLCSGRWTEQKEVGLSNIRKLACCFHKVLKDFDTSLFFSFVCFLRNQCQWNKLLFRRIGKILKSRYKFK